VYVRRATEDRGKDVNLAQVDLVVDGIDQLAGWVPNGKYVGNSIGAHRQPIPRL